MRELVRGKGVHPKVARQLRQARPRHAHHAVNHSVLGAQGVSVLAKDPTAGKGDLGHVTRVLVVRLESEDRLNASTEDRRGIVTIEQRRSQPIGRT